MDYGEETRDEKVSLVLEGLAQSPYNLPQGYLSYSQIDLFIKCPKRYEYKYIDKLPQRSSSSQARGKAVHAVLEQLHRFKKHGEIPSWGITEALLVDAVTAEAKFVEEWDEKVTSTEHAINSSKTALKVYVEQRLPNLEVRATEQHVQGNINGRVPYMGYIDVVEAGEVDPAPGKEYGMMDSIRDVKTTTKAYGPAEVVNSLQLSLYSGITGVPTVAYDLLISKSNGTAVYLPQSSVRSIGEVQHAYDVAEDVAKAVSAGSFPRTSPQNWMCMKKWCPFFDRCRGKTQTTTHDLAPVSTKTPAPSVDLGTGSTASLDIT